MPKQHCATCLRTWDRIYAEMLDRIKQLEQDKMQLLGELTYARRYHPIPPLRTTEDEGGRTSPGPTAQNPRAGFRGESDSNDLG